MVAQFALLFTGEACQRYECGINEMLPRLTFASLGWAKITGKNFSGSPRVPESAVF